MKLHKGDIIMLNGREHQVDMVNECRARCVPVAREAVTVKTVEGAVQFTRLASSVSISPHAEVGVVRRAAKPKPKLAPLIWVALVPAADNQIMD